MKPEDFVRDIRSQIIDDNLNIYKELFSSTKEEDATDNYFKSALKLYNSLDTESREILFKIIRQVEVDSVSSILGILDGVAMLENQKKDFNLTMEDSDELLNGDLQSLFLEAEVETNS